MHSDLRHEDAYQCTLVDHIAYDPGRLSKIKFSGTRMYRAKVPSWLDPLSIDGANHAPYPLPTTCKASHGPTRMTVVDWAVYDLNS